MTEPVTVLIARFEDLIARGLWALIDGDPSVRLVDWDIEHGRLGAALEKHRPNVAILNFGALDSPAEVRELRRRYPDTNLVLLANHPSSAECAQMLAFGASACLGKATQARDILNATHLASRGLQVLPYADADQGGPSTLSSELLTRREADVLALLREALPNAQIAATLHVSIETVRTHARNIYRKLGVSSRRELLAPTVGLRPVEPSVEPSIEPSVAVPRAVASGRHLSRRGAHRPSHG